MLQLGNRTRRYDCNRIAYFDRIARIVRKILLRTHEVFFVLRVLDLAIDLNGGGIFHRRLYDSADE